LFSDAFAVFQSLVLPYNPQIPDKVKRYLINTSFFWLRDTELEKEIIEFMCLYNRNRNNDTIVNLASYDIYYVYSEILLKGQTELKKIVERKKYGGRITF
jgi:hypothetical protein